MALLSRNRIRTEIGTISIICASTGVYTQNWCPKLSAKDLGVELTIPADTSQPTSNTTNQPFFTRNGAQWPWRPIWNHGPVPRHSTHSIAASSPPFSTASLACNHVCHHEFCQSRWHAHIQELKLGGHSSSRPSYSAVWYVKAIALL